MAASKNKQSVPASHATKHEIKFKVTATWITKHGAGITLLHKRVVSIHFEEKHIWTDNISTKCDINI